MNIVVHPTLCGISLKRGGLLGRRDSFPMVTLSLLFAKVHFLGRDASDELMTCLRAMYGDPEWLMKNVQGMRKYKDKVESEAFKRHREYREQEFKSLRDRYDEMTLREMKAREENRHLRTALSIMKGEGEK